MPRLSGSTYQRPLDTELGFIYGVDITAQGEYRGVCVSRVYVPPLPQCANVTNPLPCAPEKVRNQHVHIGTLLYAQHYKRRDRLSELLLLLGLAACTCVSACMTHVRLTECAC